MLVSFAICTSLIAQDASLAPLRKLQKGDRALQFGVQGLINLRSFQGSTVSYKKHLSSKTAFRLGVDFRMNNSAIEGTEERDVFSSRMDFVDSSYNAYSQLENYETTGNRSEVSFGIASQFVVYPAARAKLQPYWGLGPTAHVSTRRIENESSSQDSTADARISQYLDTSYDLGFSGMLGL